MPLVTPKETAERRPQKTKPNSIIEAEGTPVSVRHDGDGLIMGSVDRTLTYRQRGRLRQRKYREIVVAYLDAQPHLPPEVDAVLGKWKRPHSNGVHGEPLFYKIFGDNPKVGDSATLGQVFERTLKGVDKMNDLMRRWAKQGRILVEYKFNEDDPLRSLYTIIKFTQ